MDKKVILEILEDDGRSVAEKIEAILINPVFKKDSYGSHIAKEIVKLSAERITNDNREQISQLISEMIAVRSNPDHDDGSIHKANRAFLEAGILDAEDLLVVARNVTVSSLTSRLIGMDRIIRYLCGLKN